MAEPATTLVVQAGEQRIARLESLRAVAALAVAVAHAWGFSHAFGPGSADSYFARVIFGGGFGVYLFFALTGYLLFWPFARRDFAGGAQVDLAGYARNRVLRILPLYFVAVAVLMVLREDGGTLGLWARFLTLTENFSSATVASAVNPILWSVVVEVHFYALLPFLAYAIGRFAGGSRARAALILLVLGLAGLAIYLAKVGLAEPASPLWRYNLPATFLFFIPGMLLALLRLELMERRPAWLDGPLGSSTLWIAASAAVWMVIFTDYSLTPLAAIAAFLLVGACCLPLRESTLRRSLDWRPLAALGVVSYSFYVWHMPIQEAFFIRIGPGAGLDLAMIAALFLAIVAAFVSYRLVEAPFLRLRRRWSRDSAL